MKQVHDHGVCEPWHATMLTKDALGYLMFLIQKWNGTIKGRGCADSQKQNLWMSKEDSPLPTMAVESVY